MANAKISFYVAIVILLVLLYTFGMIHLPIFVLAYGLIVPISMTHVSVALSSIPVLVTVVLQLNPPIIFFNVPLMPKQQNASCLHVLLAAIVASSSMISIVFVVVVVEKQFSAMVFSSSRSSTLHVLVASSLGGVHVLVICLQFPIFCLLS